MAVSQSSGHRGSTSSETQNNKTVPRSARRVGRYAKGPRPTDGFAESTTALQAGIRQAASTSGAHWPRCTAYRNGPEASRSSPGRWYRSKAHVHTAVVAKAKKQRAFISVKGA